jgi:hypothetical protein
MDRFDRFHADDHGSVNWRAGLFQNSRHAERLILVFCKRRETVGHDDGITDAVSQFCRDIGPNDRIKQVIHDGPVGHGERSALPIFIMLKEGFRRPHHAELTVAVAQRDRHDPFNLWPCGDILVALPRHVVGCVADAEYGIEQELHRPRPCANNQVGTGYRIGKAGLGPGPHLFDTKKQRDGQGDRNNGHTNGQRTRK